MEGLVAQPTKRSASSTYAFPTTTPNPRVATINHALGSQNEGRRHQAAPLLETVAPKR
jgi:hypothetical protein